MKLPTILLTNCRVFGTDHDSIAITGNTISYIGTKHQAPCASDTIDCSGRLVTPGLIDCHTHLVWAGDRANEFTQRVKGRKYSEIAAAGSGIYRTVESVRRASIDELYEAAAMRVLRLAAEGVTCIEIKSGYGHDLATETKMLEVATRLGEEMPVRIHRTFLGAHSVPAETDADTYLAEVTEEWLPELARRQLIDSVDIYIEDIAFTPTQAERLFMKAGELGLAIRAHTEQFTASGGARLAAEYGALSVDHLEYVSDADAAVLNGTTAVLLPTAFYYLKEPRQPPVAVFRRRGIPMAVASDANPGSSPSISLRLAMMMAMREFALTPDEVLAGVTTHAAGALGMGREIGGIEVGKLADIIVWEAQEPAQICQGIGMVEYAHRFFNGRNDYEI